MFTTAYDSVARASGCQTPFVVTPIENVSLY